MSKRNDEVAKKLLALAMEPSPEVTIPTATLYILAQQLQEEEPPDFKNIEWFAGAGACRIGPYRIGINYPNSDRRGKPNVWWYITDDRKRNNKGLPVIILDNYSKSVDAAKKTSVTNLKRLMRRRGELEEPTR